MDRSFVLITQLTLLVICFTTRSKITETHSHHWYTSFEISKCIIFNIHFKFIKYKFNRFMTWIQVLPISIVNITTHKERLQLTFWVIDWKNDGVSSPELAFWKSNFLKWENWGRTFDKIRIRGGLLGEPFIHGLESWNTNKSSCFLSLVFSYSMLSENE